MANRVFCFGSNEAGRHGKGAAHFALLHHGAVYGQGFGHMGNCFAIPTKDHNLHTLPMASIQRYVELFLDYAHDHPELEFQVTRIGCGLAWRKDEDIAPLFQYAPDNCLFDLAWGPYLTNRRYWGTF